MAADRTRPTGSETSGGQGRLSQYSLGPTNWAELSEAVSRLDFGIVVWEGGIVRLANQQAADLVGMSLDDVIGQPISKLTHRSESVQRGIDDLADGLIDSFRARDVIEPPGRAEVSVWVNSRAVEADGKRFVVSIVVREDQVGSLGRSPLRSWMDIVPVCVGMADRKWRIEAISLEIYDLLGRLPRECVGERLTEWMGPAEAHELANSLIGTVPPKVFPRIRMSAADGSSRVICLLLGPGASSGPSVPAGAANVVFGLVGHIEDCFPVSLDRVAELEMRLRNIAAEVRAASILQSFDSLPSAVEHPELLELTSRQWEIVNRIARGQRVATIAAQLFISPSTVRNHLVAIFEKFGVHTQAELVERLRRTAPSRSGPL